jgi:CheY-like chemotaxis protein
MSNYTVLYVEDDPINAFIVERLLGKYFTIKIARNGEEALQLVQQKHFDLILMDINLGSEQMDGTETMRMIKALDAYKNTKVFAVTSYAMPEDRVQFLRNGFDDYFSKPIDQLQLKSAIEQVLQTG